MKKRILSMILATVTTMSVLSVPVYAKAPGVETLSATDVEEDCATVRGMVTSNSGIKIKEYGFQYGKSSSTLSYKKFYAGKDFDYPDPINNDVIECELTNLSDGTEYHFEFYAINENGEKTIGKSKYFETEGDDEDPEITKFKSSAGTSFEEGTEVTFTASADDNKEVTEMHMYIDGDEVKSSKSDSIKYTTDDLEEGEYLFAVTAKDKAKNEAIEYLDITVTSAKKSYNPPEIYSHRNGGSYDADDFEIEWDEVDGAKRYRLAVRSENDGSYAADIYYNDNLTDNYFTVSESKLKPGHSYKIWVGACGNSHEDVLSQNSIIVTVKEAVVADTTPPTVNIRKPQNGATINKDYYDTVEFYITAEDESGIESIELYKNGYQYISSNNGLLSDTIECDELNVGRNDFQIIAIDKEGNQKTQQVYITITETEKAPVVEEIKEEKDTEAPVVFDFECDAGKVVNRDEVDKITFSASAMDNKGVETMTLSMGTPISSKNGSSIKATVKTNGLRLGENEFYIIAEDEAGNEGYSDSIYITITEDEEDEDEDYSFSKTPQQDKDETNSDGSWGETDIWEIHDKAHSKADSYGGIKVYVNGEKLYFDVQPQAINNRTMVPLRAIFEALGATVEWNGELQKVTAQNDKHAVELVLGESTMNVWHFNFSGPSGWMYLDSPAVAIDGRTLVPVRAISESFNCDVQWYGDKQLVSIVSMD